MAFGKRSNNEEYDNTNKGILFEVEDPKSNKHPTYRGTLNVGGEEYWISGWDKDTKKGPALSLAIDRKQDQRATSNAEGRRNDRQGDRREERRDNPPPAVGHGDNNEPPPPTSQDDYGEAWDDRR